MSRPGRPGAGFPLLSGSLGGSPDQPGGNPAPPDCCAIDDADLPDRGSEENGGSMVALGGGGAAAFVQKASVNIDDDTITLPAPPTIGNLLVVWVTVRSTAFGFTPPTGFTQVGSTVTTTADAFVQRKGAMAYRLVQPGDTDTVDIGACFGTGVSVMGSLTEFSGVGAPEDDASLSDQTEAVTTTAGGSVTAAGSAVVVGGAVIGGTNPSSGGDGASALTPGASITELHDLRNNNDSSPRLWSGYRIVTVGSYTITADHDDATARVWGGVTASFPAADAAWVLPAPNANDVDDSTYHTITGTDLLRLDMGAEYRIVRTRIRIAGTNAGARTFTVKGANAVDFSDEVTLTTIDFTATGGLTAQDVTGTWYTEDSYRYYELSIDDSDTYRVHSWELYEPTLATNHQHDAPDASDIPYDNTTSGLTADDVQEAIDELEGLIGTGDFLTPDDGAGDIISTVAASGAAETIDLANGNVHDVTLTDDCTFTFTGAAAGRARSFTLVLRQGASPPHLAIWPGSVVWPSGSAPTLQTALNAVDVLTFFTLDGGTVWFGFATGGGSSVGDLDDLTDVTITAPTEDDDLRYNGSAWVNDARKWEVVTGGEDVLVWDGDDLVYDWST